MQWKKYHQMHSRTVRLLKDSAIADVKVTIGNVYTGKQRVFAGFFCQIECNGLTILKEDRWNLHRSLLEAAKEVSGHGYALDLYGLQSRYSESGLCENSGYGYVPSIRKAVLMIDPIGAHESKR